MFPLTAAMSSWVTYLREEGIHQGSLFAGEEKEAQAPRDGKRAKQIIEPILEIFEIQPSRLASGRGGDENDDGVGALPEELKAVIVIVRAVPKPTVVCMWV